MPFHNPYNFIPTPPGSPKRDHAPVGHNRYFSRHWSGRLRVTMTTVTPLLIPDAGSADEIFDQQHKTFPLRIGVDGKPYVAPSSVKGMLRAAFEAITNSRFGVFNQDKRLARRMPAPEGLSLVPARIEGDKIVIYQGTTSGLPTAGANGKWNVPGVQYAAWLPRYPRALTSTTGAVPHHGEQVHCWVELFQHHRWNRDTEAHQGDFQFWRVRAIANNAAGLGPPPAPTGSVPNWRADRARSSYHEPLSLPMKQIRGYVCIGNQNIKGKHDERVLFLDPSIRRIEIGLLDQHKTAWQDLISSYQSLHERELEERRRKGQAPEQYLGHEPGNTAYSRHVYSPGDRDLADGTLCYARIAQTNGVHVADALYPVMISRQLNAHSPSQLLDPSLHPAANIRQLSHADRVFGWVKQGADKQSGRLPVAYRGQLRIGPLTCTQHDAVEDFGIDGLPLANLSAPKPQQARFYVGDANGNPMPDGAGTGDAGFGYQSRGNRLRGRKVYPFHKGLAQDYWRNPLNQPGVSKEYIRVGGMRNSQNRSIRGWVRPNARFSFDVWVTNLSRIELGALLWLLQLPSDHHLSLGGGKPLGFGTVHLNIDWSQTELQNGDTITNRFRDLNLTAAEPIGEDADSTSTTIGYMRAMLKSYGAREQIPDDSGQVIGLFEDISFIKAFLRAASGHPDGLPTHYPRHTVDPHVQGENYRWFVANERGHKLALARLDTDPGLPLLGGN